jgi:hypothetical protein
MRGPDQVTAASTPHVAARPAYIGHRPRLSPNTIRSYSHTVTGAVTIDSLHAMPAAHETTATSGQFRALA